MKKPRYYLLVVLLVMSVILVISLALAIRINEVMYNPIGSDNNKEFVEILGTNNLSGYIIGDPASNDSLELIRFVNRNISLIVEEGFNYTSINCSIYSAGSTIGNNLNNEGDTILLYYNNTLIDSMSYNGSLANNNGYSLELVNNSWQESCKAGGSPGRENCIKLGESVNDIINETINRTTNQTQDNTSQEDKTAGLKLEIIIPETLFLGSVYNSLFKISNLNHALGEEDFVFVIVKYNVTQNNSLVKEDYFNKTINYYSSANTGKLFFERTGNYTLCGIVLNTSISVCKDLVVINPLSIPCFIELNLSTNKDIYLNREEVKIKNSISNKSFPYLIEYWVEDLFGNYVKKRYNTSNTNQKAYTPKIVEKDRVFIVKNRLVFVACNNSNSVLENEKMIIIKKDEASIGRDDDTDSSISIDYIYLPGTRTLSFGDDFKVKLSIHKGDTSKSMIKLFVEKNNKRVSEETRFYLNKKDYDYNLTVKVFLKPNCNYEFSDGTYNLVVDGLGKKTNEEIEIKRNKKGVCKEEIKENGEITSFYTISKKYKERINLYANVKINATHDLVYDLVLISKKGEQNRTVNDSKKVKFIADSEPGTNLFVLELRKDGKIIDTKSLLVELEEEKEKTSLTSSLLLEKDNKTGKEVSKETSKESNTRVNYSLKPISGRVVYESDNTRILRYTPYLLILILTLIIVRLIFSERR